MLLEERFGRLPDDWHLRRVDELDALDRRVGPPRLDTTALLRAVGILLVVSTHMHLWYFPGGSHLMLGVVGYNASRFLFSIERPRRSSRRRCPFDRSPGRSRDRLRRGLHAARRRLRPGDARPRERLPRPGRRTSTVRWHYWFIEVVVQLLLLTTLLLAIGPVRRLERRFAVRLPAWPCSASRSWCASSG